MYCEATIPVLCLSMSVPGIIYVSKRRHLSCEVERLAETHVCKLRARVCTMHCGGQAFGHAIMSWHARHFLSTILYFRTGDQ